MVVGFNHNVRYDGELYHVQTEDGGLKNPCIITHLYRGGTIVASQKTSYADIIKADGLSAIVEDLMKEQHKTLLRRLKDGEFDALIAQRFPAVPALSIAPDEKLAPAPPQAPGPAVPSPPPAGQGAVASLDDLIFSYLTAKDH
ncbi:hypothetical protein [Geoalkalibacter halelectricus]|uniref:Uncharacterized protein n=1 Tax=Geoalkalibacter halelectricus TaxID=2847045 RepID=A0ABY5ZSW9_9BACT|nr:hypothetical protein [Geoalkalibacter halelectricus]MDO3377477.1 hypothetical protein [Geoalkalibacter halelectricus]UWZ80764.1 hypothetical protein L9S41_05015 [Geoalkalibacter halelectricus]